MEVSKKEKTTTQKQVNQERKQLWASPRQVGRMFYGALIVRSGFYFDGNSERIYPFVCGITFQNILINIIYLSNSSQSFVFHDFFLDLTSILLGRN